MSIKKKLTAFTLAAAAAITTPTNAQDNNDDNVSRIAKNVEAHCDAAENLRECQGITTKLRTAHQHIFSRMANYSNSPEVDEILNDLQENIKKGKFDKGFISFIKTGLTSIYLEKALQCVDKKFDDLDDVNKFKAAASSIAHPLIDYRECTGSLTFEDIGQQVELNPLNHGM